MATERDLLFIPSDKGDPLHGIYFHTWRDDGKLEKQGFIIRKVDNFVLVAFFEWGWGEISTLRLFPLDKIKEWTLYKSQEDMTQAWEDLKNA